MIFFFSGTGNSEYTAKKIAAVSGDRVVSIGESVKAGNFWFEPGDGEQVGFVFPVYFYGVPTIVLDFIERLDLQGCDNNYIFAVCCSGGDAAGTLSMFRKALRRRGIGLDAAFEVTMPDNYILMFDLLPPPDKAVRLLREAETTVAGIASDVTARKKITVERSLVRSLKTRLSYGLYKYDRSTRPFHVTEECSGCGLCARLCPCSTIEMKDKRPVWKEGRCTQCLSCLHRCPRVAVQYGKKTQNRGRYVNPDLKRISE